MEMYEGKDEMEFAEQLGRPLNDLDRNLLNSNRAAASTRDGVLWSRITLGAVLLLAALQVVHQLGHVTQ